MSDYRQYLKVFAQTQQLNIPILEDEDIAVPPIATPTVPALPKPPTQDYRQLHIPFPEGVNTRPSPQTHFPGFESTEIKCADDSCHQIGTMGDEMLLDPHDKKYYCEEHQGLCESCKGRCPVDSMVQARNVGMICESCRNEGFFYCDTCDEIVDDDDMIADGRLRRGQSTKEHIGCEECSARCNHCNKAGTKDHMQAHDGDWYCEECFSEYFDFCSACQDYVSRDESHYVESVGESFCSYHYGEKFFNCDECSEDFSNDEVHEVTNNRGRDVMVCNECFENEYGGRAEEDENGTAVPQLPKGFNEYEAVSGLRFNKKMRHLNQLKKFLPMSVKDMKSKLPLLFNKSNELITFAKGGIITTDVVDQYEKTLPADDYQLGYSTWHGMQRSIRSAKGQLVINIKAGPEFKEKIDKDPVILDLFNKINTISKQSGHPSATNQIGWARLELDPEKQFILVDEIQTDHMNAAFKIKSETGYGELVNVRAGLKKQYDLNDEEFNEKLNKFLSLLKDFPDVATEAISEFARKNGFKKIFWHTFESGKELKGNNPPKSLYTTVPKENLFKPTDDKPFGLNGDFLERDASSKNKLIKLARRINFEYIVTA